MFERFASSTRAAVTYAVDAAAARGDRRVGTEHLLLGLLYDPAGAAKAALGTDLATARAALEGMDRDALAAVGIDATALDLDVAVAVVPSGARIGRLPFTAAAKDALGRTVRVAAARRSRMEPEHLLLALLDCSAPDPAGQLLERLGIDAQTVRARLTDAA